MVMCSFFLVAVSSYIVGLVGSSNQPVSGITICALLVSAALFTIMGMVGDSAIFATLGVAAVVCCACCTSSDCSQDLKTGLMVGATPRYQQWAQIIGILIPAFVIAPTLSLLHKAYTIGEGLKAPQATLFASITEAFFKSGTLPLSMILAGVVIGIAVIVFDETVLKPKNRFRLYLMPMAVGIYLPVSLGVPILLGGLIHHLAHKKQTREEAGVLVSSGLVAGESLMGIVLAVFIYMNMDLKIFSIPHDVATLLSLVALTGAAFWLYGKSKV